MAKRKLPKVMRPSRNFAKSPLAPLFQRGELKTSVLSNARLENFLALVPTFVTFPLWQKGDQGGFFADMKVRVTANLPCPLFFKEGK
jgi:hypothetical protein